MLIHRRRFNIFLRFKPRLGSRNRSGIYDCRWLEPSKLSSSDLLAALTRRVPLQYGGIFFRAPKGKKRARRLSDLPPVCSGSGLFLGLGLGLEQPGRMLHNMLMRASSIMIHLLWARFRRAFGSQGDQLAWDSDAGRPSGQDPSIIVASSPKRSSSCRFRFRRPLASELAHWLARRLPACQTNL